MARNNDEGHEKVAGETDHEPGHGGREEARKIPHEVLKSRPAARHPRTGQRLRNRPDIGPAHSARAKRQEQQNHQKPWAGESAPENQQPGSPRSYPGKRFAHHHRSSASRAPPVPNPPPT